MVKYYLDEKMLNLFIICLEKNIYVYKIIYTSCQIPFSVVCIYIHFFVLHIEFF